MLPTEHQEQAAVVQWFDLAYPKLAGRLFAVPNGAHLAGNAQQRAAKVARLKAEGFRVGVPDLWLPVPRDGLHGLVIELKRIKGSKVSAEQLDWLDWLGSQGYQAALCKGADAAIATIKAYLSPSAS